MGKIGIILLTIVICMVVFGSFAYASGTFQKDIPATVNIKSYSPDMAFFSNAACTIPLTNVSFGDVMQSKSAMKAIYVKNVGNVILNNVSLATDMPPTQGTVTMNAAPFSLAVTGSRQVEITLSIAQTATVEDGYNPMIYFDCD